MTVLSLYSDLGTLAKNHPATNEWVYFWTLIIFHWPMSFLMLVLYCFDYYNFMVVLKETNVSFSSLFLFSIVSDLRLFVKSIWIWGLAFSFLQKWLLKFGKGCIECIDCFGNVSIYIKSHCMETICLSIDLGII